MVYDEIVIKNGDTLPQLADDYGYKATDWDMVWSHPKNATLKTQRGVPNQINPGDKIIIPLPWKITSKIMTLVPGNKFRIDVLRDGTKGKNLRWVQTVFQDNQPIGNTSTFCADACPGDDDDPFYYTDLELANNGMLRNHFLDTPFRMAPANRTTTWRAVLSLCSVVGKRVSVFESIVWGVDFGKNGTNSKYAPRAASAFEINGHIKLLNMGMGKTKSFKSQGWTFRQAPTL